MGLTSLALFGSFVRNTAVPSSDIDLLVDLAPGVRFSLIDLVSVKDFLEDRRTRQLVERNLEILSEASRRLSADLKEMEPDTPWRAIAGIGNVLRHDYHDSYRTVLWDTCNKDLKPLKDAVARIGAFIAKTKGSAKDTKG
jgi:uncharacterized protein with HEPN domain